MPRSLSSTGIERLALYYRHLGTFPDPEEFVKSDELAEAISHSAAQVRRDLSCFGAFGTPGKGYRVGELRSMLEKILGKRSCQNVILVGVGNLGTALLAYKGFGPQKYEIVAAFDNDVRKIGKRIEDLEIQDTRDLASIIASTGAKLAVVCVPSPAAQRAIDELIAAGIRGILNFAPTRVVIPEYVALRNVDLSVELDRVCYLLDNT